MRSLMPIDNFVVLFSENKKMAFDDLPNKAKHTFLVFKILQVFECQGDKIACGMKDFDIGKVDPEFLVCVCEKQVFIVGIKNYQPEQIQYIFTMAFNPQDFVSPYVTLEEVLQVKKAFDLFDRDLGGAIDPRQLKVAINSLGIEAKAQVVYQMIAQVDKDGSGQIDFPEFFYMMTTRPSDNETRDQVHKVFITFDAQKTGFIALKDLRKVAKDLGELTDDNTLQEMIERADIDGDGVVSEEEFYALITKKAH